MACCAPVILRLFPSMRITRSVDLARPRGAAPQQIEDITLISYVPKAEKSDTGEMSQDSKGQHTVECAICLKDFVAGDSCRLLPCDHMFHQYVTLLDSSSHSHVHSYSLSPYIYIPCNYSQLICCCIYLLYFYTRSRLLVLPLGNALTLGFALTAPVVRVAIPLASTMFPLVHLLPPCPLLLLLRLKYCYDHHSFHISVLLLMRLKLFKLAKLERIERD